VPKYVYPEGQTTEQTALQGIKVEEQTTRSQASNHGKEEQRSHLDIV